MAHTTPLAIMPRPAIFARCSNCSERRTLRRYRSLKLCRHCWPHRRSLYQIAKYRRYTE